MEGAMGARIPPAKRMKIEALRHAGERMQDIADAVGVSLSTVRRVCRATDKEYVLETTPAAGLTGWDVTVVKMLAAQYRLGRCEGCGREVIARRAGGRVRCLGCG